MTGDGIDVEAIRAALATWNRPIAEFGGPRWRNEKLHAKRELIDAAPALLDALDAARAENAVHLGQLKVARIQADIYEAERDDALAEAARLREAVEMLHRPHKWFGWRRAPRAFGEDPAALMGETICSHDGRPWPCPTVAALSVAGRDDTGRQQP